MGSTDESPGLQGAGSVPQREVPEHQWVLNGIWYLTESQIRESERTGESLRLHQPDAVNGPGCIVCGQHWMIAKGEPCPGDGAGTGRT